jgi:hypothetical protein
MSEVVEHWHIRDACLCPHHVGRTFAVERLDGWHIAVWDGACFAVTSSWQSGDRWLPEQVESCVMLPKAVER